MKPPEPTPDPEGGTPAAGARRSAPARRPWSVTITGAAVLSLAVVYWMRFALALTNWDFLRRLLPFSPVYLALTGAVWGALAVACVWRLWLGLRYARELALAFSVLFSVYYWLDRLLAAGQRDWSVNRPFALGINILWLAWLGWAFSRRGTRRFFEGTIEQSAKNHSTA
ncbi:MAG: hypothetical protein M5U05_13790 [Anaerolineales bacterium]|jgi:hypothetical protein|nr:hypothetical protein [Anaerolineales bacterium]